MNPETLTINIAPFMRVNIDAINELNQIMNNTKITDQRTAHDAIRNKQLIVGSFHPTTGMSFSNTPTVQYSAAQARAECKRLAKNLSRQDILLCSTGGCRVDCATTNNCVNLRNQNA